MGENRSPPGRRAGRGPGEGASRTPSECSPLRRNINGFSRSCQRKSNGAGTHGRAGEPRTTAAGARPLARARGPCHEAYDDLVEINERRAEATLVSARVPWRIAPAVPVTSVRELALQWVDRLAPYRQ